MVKHTQAIRRQFADELFECVWSSLKGLSQYHKFFLYIFKKVLFICILSQPYF